MNWGAIIIVVIYLLVTLLLPLYTIKGNTVINMSYTVGGRQFGTSFISLTLLSIAVGAASIVGYTGWYYQRGLSQLWFVISVAPSYLIYILYLAPKISEFELRHGSETTGDQFCYHHGKGSQFLCSMITMIGYLAITVSQYMVMASIFVKLTNLSYATSLLITTVIITLRTTHGGLWAVASNNVLQGSTTLIGLVILAFCLTNNAGGLSTVFASAPAEHFQLSGYFTSDVTISSVLVFLPGIVSWLGMWQQCYTAKDQKTLRKSMILFLIVLSVLRGGIIIIIGLSALSLRPGYETPENILPFTVVDQFNTIVGALFLSVLLAVIMGGADTLLLVSSMTLHKDIYNRIRPQASEKESLWISKVSSLAYGVIVIFLVIVTPSMFGLRVMSADLMSATLAVSILLGFAQKESSTLSGLASTIAGPTGRGLAYIGIIPIDDITLETGFSLATYILAAYSKSGSKEKNIVIDQVQREI